MQHRNIIATVIAFCLFLFALSIQAQTAQDTSINYIRQEAPGFKARLIKVTARLLLPKNNLPRKLSKDHFVSEAAKIPKKIHSEFRIDTNRVNGRMVYTISPQGKRPRKYVLFLHGGSYVNNIFRQHWKFAAEVIRRTNSTFILPDYPLAPAATFQEAFAMLEAVYKRLLSQTDAKDIILMGDSAGGGLALAFAMKLRNTGTLSPAAIILLCPWLDISMTNPQITEVQKNDVTLRANNLVLAGKVWAGKTETNNYLLSPIYGSFEELPKISVFIGTHDILVPDCRKLKAIMEQKGIKMNYFEYPEMFHDWVMLGHLNESKLAISQISSLINDKYP